MPLVTLAYIQGLEFRHITRKGESVYVCPTCGKPKFEHNVAKNLWKCWVCDEGGKVGQEGRETFRPPKPVKPQRPPPDWPEVVRKARLQMIGGSPGQGYLESRGIPLWMAQMCGVRFAPRIYDRRAVVFDITNPAGELVAVQWRYITSGEPRMLGAGPKSDGLFQLPGAFDVDEIAIVEAPIDAMSLHLLRGLTCVATCGSGNPTWMPPQVPWKRVWIATDADAPGDKYFEKWAPALIKAGAVVERMTPSHGKDWNEELLFLRKES